MSLRICLVSPFAWSQPHPVNEHVAGVAAALRRRGHAVTVLAPSNKAADLRAGRKALDRARPANFIALGPAIPLTRRSSIGVPVGVRANLALALAAGEFDVVHGVEPGLPSLSYLALRDTRTLTVASFLSPDRLAYQPRRARRERLLTRTDALIATDQLVARAAEERFPGDYTILSEGVDTELFRPAAKRKVVAIEWRSGERAVARNALRALRESPGWEAVLVRTKPLVSAPTPPRGLQGRVSVRTARAGHARAKILNEAAIFVPAPGGLPRLRLEAQAAGAAIADPPNVAEQPELAAAAVARLTEDAELRERMGREARAAAELNSFDRVADELEQLYTSLGGRRRKSPSRPTAVGAEPLADRDWILVDLHMHTSWSHDCQVPPADLVAHAESIGLGAIAITDHNVFGGALECVDIARDRELIVIAGEEVKTDNQGEVIGLFLEEEIPRGMSFADTIAAIREQSGLVYLPHPFDRMHAIADPKTLHRHLGEIDVFEAFNARLYLDSYNDEALRFARKYNLVMGAGSDAHVLQGVGTGCLRMRRFDGPEEFLISLHSAEIISRPKSLLYLQSLKWASQVKDKRKVKEKSR